MFEPRAGPAHCPPAGLSAVEWFAVPAFVAGWGLAGCDGSVGRALIAHLIGSDSPALGGLALFIVSANAALAVPLLRSTPPRTIIYLGSASPRASRQSLLACSSPTAAASSAQAASTEQQSCCSPPSRCRANRPTPQSTTAPRTDQPPPQSSRCGVRSRDSHRCADPKIGPSLPPAPASHAKARLAGEHEVGVPLRADSEASGDAQRGLELAVRRRDRSAAHHRHPRCAPTQPPAPFIAGAARRPIMPPSGALSPPRHSDVLNASSMAALTRPAEHHEL